MSASPIPQWVFSCLDQYSNCACGIRIVKQLGKEGIIEELEKRGYPCELEIIADPKDTSEFTRRRNIYCDVKDHKANKKSRRRIIDSTSKVVLFYYAKLPFFVL